MTKAEPELSENHRIEEFNRSVDEWVESTIGSSGAFDQLLYSLPGVFPFDVVKSLGRLRNRRNGSAQIVDRLLRQAREPGPRISCPESIKLPTPHPLDFDWRFSTSAIDVLLTELRVERECTVGLLGAPSVVGTLAARERRFKWVILDSNSGVVESLTRRLEGIEAAVCDISRSPLPAAGSMDVVVTDPPWYQEPYCSFLWASSHLCARGGLVIACIPPEGTRPGICDERRELLAFANGVGLSLERLDSCRLPYVSPPFEVNALRAVGITGAPLDWRKADLAVFRKTGSDPLPDRPSVGDEGYSWREWAFNGIRIRFRDSNSTELSEPLLGEIFAEDVFPSVSRRHKKRAEVDVWTTGNRVFTCTNPLVTEEIAIAVSSGGSIEAAAESVLGRGLAGAERATVIRGGRKLVQILSAESEELREYSERTGAGC